MRGLQRDLKMTRVIELFKDGFDPSDGPIILRVFPNSGWVVYQGAPEPGLMGKELGAYSSAQEMLDSLKCLIK